MFFSLIADAGQTYDEINSKVLELFNDYIIPALMTCAAIVLVVFGIVNGVRMAKAQTEEEKTKAKKNLIGLIVGAIACVASIWLIPLIIELSLGVFGTKQISPPIGNFFGAFLALAT